MKKTEKIKSQKIRLSKNDRSLQIVSILLTSISMLLILFPFVLTVSNAMKDNVKIYDVPPKLMPDSAKSLSVTVDYTGISETGKELETWLQQDMVSTMFGVYTEMDRDAVFEIKFYATQDGKTIFYSRAHQTQLQMEKDYGIYEGTVLKKQTLLYKDKAERAAHVLGYKFDLSGLPQHPAPASIQAEPMEKLSNVFAKKFTLHGMITGCEMQTKNSLLPESFVHYMRLPNYMYDANATIARFGFMSFVGNTVIVIGFAILSQVFLCSLCAFVISRLLKPKAARFMLLFFMGAQMIPFASIMLPQLIMYRNMGAYNNYAALLLPFLYPFGFYIYLFKGFFDKIPGSYFEAARLDGASNLFLYSRICMPLSKPTIALIALQTFLGNWNDFFWAWLVTERQDLWTLNVALYNISNNASTKQNALMGIALVTILPVLVITVFFSKQLKASIMSSGVKG
ncbi:MAG: carbohydrate ABC transporter permease [Ruthenibacterium sp.]